MYVSLENSIFKSKQILMALQGGGVMAPWKSELRATLGLEP